MLPIRVICALSSAEPYRQNIASHSSHLANLDVQSLHLVDQCQNLVAVSLVQRFPYIFCVLRVCNRELSEFVVQKYWQHRFPKRKRTCYVFPGDHSVISDGFEHKVGSEDPECAQPHALGIPNQTAKHGGA